MKYKKQMKQRIFIFFQIIVSHFFYTRTNFWNTI